MSLTRRNMLLGTGAALAGAATMTSFGAFAQTASTIKVGILHSLSGTMAISETTLKDVMLMLIEEQNKKGGVLGKKLEAVVVDPASELAAVRRKGPRAHLEGQGRRDLRLLDLGVAQVRSAGLQGTQLDPFLPRPVRG